MLSTETKPRALGPVLLEGIGHRWQMVPGVLGVPLAPHPEPRPPGTAPGRNVPPEGSPASLIVILRVGAKCRQVSG